MRTRLKCLFVFSLFVFVGFAEQSALTDAHGMLWKISGNGLKSPSYLFGTIHVRGGMQILDSIRNFNSIFNSTSQFLCEIRYDLPHKDIYENEKVKTMFKPWPVADSTYEKLLSKEDKILLDSIVGSYESLKNIMKYNYRPSSLMSSIKYSFELKKHPHIAKYSDLPNDTTQQILDKYLTDRALLQKMTISELDSGAWFYKFYDKLIDRIGTLSYNKEVGLLMNFIRTYAAQDSMKSKIISMYLAQDLKGITNNRDYLSVEVLPGVGNIDSKDFIFDFRNKNWMDKIVSMINLKSSFIAFGCAHLGGENGIINELRKRGYKVEPISD